MTPKITHARLLEVLHYDPATGAFTWLKNLAQKDRVGSIAGSLHPIGYTVVQVDGERIPAHRLAWFYVNNTWPDAQIDHINGRRADNAYANLRDVPSVVNQQNQRTARAGSSSGLLGVTWHKASGKWAAQIRHNNRKRHLGVFDDPDAAHAAYVDAKRELHEGCTL